MFEDVEESEFWPVCIYVCVRVRARVCVETFAKNTRLKYYSFFLSRSPVRQKCSLPFYYFLELNRE